MIQSLIAASLIATTATITMMAPQYAPAVPPAAADAPKTGTIVEVAKGAGQFNTLCELLVAADLVDTLNGKGPFTVFAPTDAAFAKLPPETVAALKKDKKALANILTYHVCSGKVVAADVVKATEVVTVQGQPVTIKVVEGKVMLNNGCCVVKTDINASNGVIHVCDTVLMPPAKKDAAAK